MKRLNIRKLGLARALSKLGFCSRSQAAELIRAGRVQVNGRVRRDPESPTSERDRILVDGKPAAESARVYVMLNKPRGLVTTRSDEKGRATIYECLGGPHLASFAKCGERESALDGPHLPGTRRSVPRETQADKCGEHGSTRAEPPWLAPVGRLDQASEGLLLLTNDSEWAGRVTDPEQHLDKTYHVQIDRVADDALLRSLVEGVRATNDPAPKGRNMKARHGSAGKTIPISSPHQSRRDGISDEILRAKSARLLRSGEKNSWLEIVLDEGRNRQIRRMLDALDVEVLRLIRVAIGPLQLGDLPKGQWRELTKEEKRAIDRALSI